jgi:SAM-dependent methyltransferase
MRNETSSPAFFENKYRQNVDPWDFEHSAYELERYASIFRAADGRHYSRAFEPGCSIGILTQKLACLCDRLEAVDISPTAISNARQRCRDLAHVHIWCGSLPNAIPTGKFDLIVFSEIGYYFERGQLQEIVNHLAENLNPGGVFIAAHWLGTSADHALSGDEVHRIIRECSQLSLDDEGRYAHFRLDRMVRK